MQNQQITIKKANAIYDHIRLNNLAALECQIYDEEILKLVSQKIVTSKQQNKYLSKLIDSIPGFSKNYDWNVGSILQHLEVKMIIDILKSTKPLSKLYGSIGLSWVLGEFKNTHPFIVDFLYSVIYNSNNSDAWWRAAFSLEKLGIDEAVNLLRRSLKLSNLKSLDYYLHHLEDKKSIICILIYSNVDNIEKKIYPQIKKNFLSATSCSVVINCCWLIGRLKLIDNEVFQKLISLMKHNNYELKYYTFFALEENATENMRLTLEKALFDQNALIRKMVARSLLSIGNEKSLEILEKALFQEKDHNVISEISKTIYALINPTEKNKLSIKIKSYKNENGMIIDDSDKWYQDPAIYNVFSEAEDPENICFSLICKKILHKQVNNPIDIATGTGRMIWQILDKMNFSGTLFATDVSAKMCEYTVKNIKRERKYTTTIKVIQSSTDQLDQNINIKSNFIISSFGFPSKIGSRDVCLQELKSIYNILSDDGLFFTIGWDETFTDELSTMWFKYIPDNIQARHFEEWRKIRSDSITSSRNCHLKWFKQGIQCPLQFSSLKEAADVMGYLFGRDAARYIVTNEKTEWTMSLGITCNTKKEIANIIKQYEKRS